jgi:hypothetical protein
MTALAKTQLHLVQAAIEKLTRLRDSAGYEVTNGWLVDVSDYEPTPLTNDELIVTLHSTVDVQLALLSEAENYIADWVKAHPSERGAEPTAVYRHELDLAEAINRSTTA